MNFNLKKIIVAQSLLASMFISAQATQVALPGDKTLPSSKESLEKLATYDVGSYKYEVEDYFAQPKANLFLISPDGKYLSYKEKDDKKKNHIYIKQLSTGKITRIAEEKEDLIRGYGWLDKSTIYYLQDKGGNENYHLFSVDIDNKNNKDLTPFDDVRVYGVSIVKGTSDVIIMMNKNNKQVNEPFRVNTKTGKMVQLFENKDIKNPVSEFIFDELGSLRGYDVLENGTTTKTYYKDLTSGQFNLVKTTSWKDRFDILGFNRNSVNKNEAYVLTNLDSDKTKIVLYDFLQNKIIKEVYSDPTFDMDSHSTAEKKRGYELDYITYNAEKSVIVPISKYFKTIYNDLKEEFKDKEFSILSTDDDENVLLVHVASDKQYGSYYEYTTKDRKIKLLYELMPQLKEEDMAVMKPIKFKSRDGLTIYGYITLPKEALAGKKVPMIVNPHGGPQGIRDKWRFNPEAQLFASRGYATLQVNFRISGGYGKEFKTTGYKQIGRKVMDDIEDGVQYAIEQGWVDKDKIAIYGGSHGGYATLMGLIKTPDLYVCGVDYVGVSNIFTFFKSFPEYWKPYVAKVKEIWYDIDNPEEAEIAKQASPIFQIDKIKKPLFVVQGANDPRVNINESDQIVKALRGRGFDVPYMVKYDEGHGYHKENNKIELYKSMLGFFAKNFNKK